MKNFKRTMALILCLLLIGSLSACGTSAKTKLVQINDKTITAADRDQYFPLYGLTTGVDVTTITDETTIKDMKTAALEDLVVMEVVKQYYNEKKQDVIPETRDADFAKFMESANADETTKTFMAANNITEAYLQEFFDNQYYTTAFYQEVVGANSTLEADAKAYYDANLPEFTKDQVKASHILVATQAEADAILQELKDGKDFAELAKTKSLDTTSGPKGGDLGYFSQEEVLAAISDAAFATEKGGLSPVVKSDYGFHIIKVTDKRTYTQTFAEAQQQIMYGILEKAYQTKLDAIKATMKIKYFN
jgi:foldase protein PrsA